MSLEITTESPITNDNGIDLRILFNNEDNVNGTTAIGDVPIFSLFKALVLMFFAPLIVCCNCLVLVALYRFKRLRTASNYFLVSLAASDLGIGLCLPVTFHMHLTESKQITSLSLPSVACYIPFCISITLCSASVSVT